MSALYQERLKRLAQARLYAILDFGYVPASEIEDVTMKLVDGGVDIIQLRAKHHTADEVAVYACRMRSLIPEHGPLFMINDHPSIVTLVGADGAHVGQDDVRISNARQQIGPDALIGKSTHSTPQAISAEQEKPDYIGVGPIFATPTKPDYQPVGVSLIRQVKERVSVPQFCIGGIHLENLRDVLAAGAERVVIVSALLQSREIVAYAQRVRSMIENYAPLDISA